VPASGAIGTGSHLALDVVDRAGRRSRRGYRLFAEGRGYARRRCGGTRMNVRPLERQFEYRISIRPGSAAPRYRPAECTSRYGVDRSIGCFVPDVNVPTGEPTTRRIILDRLDDLPPAWWGGRPCAHELRRAYRNTPAHLAFQARRGSARRRESDRQQGTRIPDIAYFRSTPIPHPAPRSSFGTLRNFTPASGSPGILAPHLALSAPESPAINQHRRFESRPDECGGCRSRACAGSPRRLRPSVRHQARSGRHTAPLFYELPVDVALGKVDYLEVMGYSDHLITSEIWYGC